METITTAFMNVEIPVVDEHDPRIIAYYWEGLVIENEEEIEGRIHQEVSVDSGHITIFDYERYNFPTEQYDEYNFYPVTYLSDEEVEEARKGGWFEPDFDPRVTPHANPHV